jgi:hypothetical protein
MSGATAIEVAIGLIFIYLLLSLTVTALQELLDAVFKLRASHLAKGIEKLLGETRAEQFFAHALIAALSPNKWRSDGTRRPSYLPASAFAMVVLDQIAPASALVPRTMQQVRDGIAALTGTDQQLKETLTALVQDPTQSLAAFRNALESCYDAQMERVSGWYKRKAHVIAVLLGLVIAVALNADSIRMAQSLASDPALRASLLAQATKMAEQPPASQTSDGEPALDPPVRHIQHELDALPALGLGMNLFWWHSTAKGVSPYGWCASIPGWLITALAVSLGAPFWFDMLNKVIAVRSGGKSPDERRRAAADG